MTYLALILSQAVLQAKQLKTEGNKVYKDGNFELAITLYNQSLQHVSEDHTVYSNLSMAYEKTRQYEKALKAAEMSTQLKPDWVKVCIRILNSTVDSG